MIWSERNIVFKRDSLLLNKIAGMIVAGKKHIKMPDFLPSTDEK